LMNGMFINAGHPVAEAISEHPVLPDNSVRYRKGSQRRSMLRYDSA
jgi:hypothetical protein